MVPTGGGVSGALATGNGSDVVVVPTGGGANGALAAGNGSWRVPAEDRDRDEE